MRARVQIAFAVGLLPLVAKATPPDGLGVVRVLGGRAESVLSPTSGSMTALFELSKVHTARGLGATEIAPGVGMLRGSHDTLLAFGRAHPDVAVEVAPPLHALLANAQVLTRVTLARFLTGADGTGTAIGVVDTGLDVTLPDFRDPKTQSSRVAWLLDLSMPPAGLHPDLEQQFGIHDQNGQLTQGAVLTGSDIDTLIGEGMTGNGSKFPMDPNGHGTHVASIAAGNGGGTAYIGMAPSAALIIVRATRDATGSFENGDILTGASFVYDRAAAMKVPVALNLSVGTDFGPHDGNSLWEKSLAALVGPANPGRVLVAAAGNSGSIVDTPIHEGVEVTGARISVPIITSAADGTVQVWVALRPGSDVKVGLDGPDGTWVGPISDGNESAHNTAGYQSGVIFGSGQQNSPVPQGSSGAIVLWSGNWPQGTYAVTLEGHGYADLYLEATGDAQVPATFFANAVRDATISLPGSNVDIIAAGCTVDSTQWISQGGEILGITAPVLDAYGGLPQTPSARVDLTNGEVCYFSSAGPNLLGVPKPDIMAPGAIVVGGMSQQAEPPSPNSIFTIDCPPSMSASGVIACNAGPCPPGLTCNADQQCVDPRCSVVDVHHAVASGTSMSSPMVAGIAALLLEQDPTLTQDVVRALLQAGAHKVRGSAPFYDQASVGEVDAVGALEALGELVSPATALPERATSWMTVSEDFAPADGATPITATVELRTATNDRASMFDLSRLQATAAIGWTPLPVTITRSAAPGLFTFTVTIPTGYAGESLTLGALFDGAPIVAPITIPVALDSWTAGYSRPYAEGGCNLHGFPTRDGAWLVGLVAVALGLRRRGFARTRS